VDPLTHSTIRFYSTSQRSGQGREAKDDREPSSAKHGRRQPRNQAAPEASHRSRPIRSGGIAGKTVCTSPHQNDGNHARPAGTSRAGERRTLGSALPVRPARRQQAERRETTRNRRRPQKPGQLPPPVCRIRPYRRRRPIPRIRNAIRAVRGLAAEQGGTESVGRTKAFQRPFRGSRIMS